MNKARIMIPTIIAVFSIAVIAGCINQTVGTGENITYSDNVVLVDVVFCKTPPNLADENLCDKLSSTTLKSLSYLAAKATNFSTVEGNWSGTCYTNVTDENGTTVLSGASTAKSVFSDRRLLCQVPIDAPNMIEGDYKVLFRVMDNSNNRVVISDADFRISR